MYNLPVSLKSCIFIRLKQRDAQGETSVRKKECVRFFSWAATVVVVVAIATDIAARQTSRCLLLHFVFETRSNIISAIGTSPLKIYCNE